MHGGRNIAPVGVTQSLEQRLDRAAQMSILTYLESIPKSFDDISQSKELQTNLQRICPSVKSRRKNNYKLDYVHIGR